MNRFIIKELLIVIIFIGCFFGNASGQDQREIDSLMNIVDNASSDTSRIYALQDLFLIYEFYQPEKALEFIDEAVRIGEETNDDRTLANSYIFRGYMSEDMGDYNGAEAYYRTAIESAKRCNFEHAIGRAINCIGEVNRFRGNYDSALVYYNKSVEIMKRINYPGNVAASLNNISLVYKELGRFKEAIEIQKEAWEINEKTNRFREVIKNMTNIGIIYYDMGDYQTSLNLYLEAAELAKKHGQSTDIGPLYNNIGLISEKLGNPDRALSYYEDAAEIYEELDLKRELAAIYDNIGNIYLHKNDFDKANEKFEKSLGFGKEINDKNSISRSLINIGNTYYFQRRFDEAVVYYTQSYEMRKEIGEKNGMAETLLNLGSAYYEKGDLDKALKYDLLGQEISESINAKESMKLAYDNLHSVYAKKDDFRNAYKFHVLYSNVKDSILNETNLKQLTQLEARYESEKKELQIEMLNKDNEVKKLVIKNKEEEVRKQQIIIFTFIGVFIIIVFFSIILIRLYRQKKAANEQLVYKNNEITQKNEEIVSQRDEIEAQRDRLSEQNELLFEQKKEITDSINYAKRIQNAILPDFQHLLNKNEIFPNDLENRGLKFEYFVLFKPKDIVSGDFYWATYINEWFIATVADCTGHGVPGAFMSMLGVSFLNEIVRKKEITKASEVLDHLRNSIIDALQQKGTNQSNNSGLTEVRDGMDMTLCVINTKERSLQFAGANNPLYILNPTGELNEISPDKQPVAIYENMRPFTNQVIDLHPNDVIYLCSDGYQDQFGGPMNKKFKKRQMKDLFLSIFEKEMSEQKDILDKSFEDWKGENEQVDDITILGIRIGV